MVETIRGAWKTNKDLRKTEKKVSAWIEKQKMPFLRQENIHRNKLLEATGNHG